MRKQGSRPSERRNVSRSLLLTGLAVAGLYPLLPGQANAQSQMDAPVAPTVGPDRAEDGLAPGTVYIEATSAGRLGDVIVAEGSVEERVLARSRQHSLRARRLLYDLGLGTGSAEGQVELTGPEGDVVHASRIELDSGFKAGIALGFATRLSNGASVMAASAVRRSESVNELNYALFTPCPICDSEGQPKRPSISLRAERIVQDENLRAILFRNAFVEVGGVPVLWLPAFAVPDPTVERASGLLAPIINYDEARGVSVEAPYLLVRSASEDWLISPQLNTEVLPFLNIQWRRRFANGTIEARAGYTYARNFGDFDLDGDGQAEGNVDFGDRTSRSYFLGHGNFDLEGPWRWGFTAERVSDKTLFDRYDVRDPYQDKGLYYGDQRRLISQLYAERQTSRSYLSIAAFSIQSLRVSRFSTITPALNVFEDDNTLPLVAPLIDGRWEPSGPILGGRLRLKASAVALERDAYVGAPVLRPELIPSGSTQGLAGVDSRRLTLQGEWRRIMTTRSGVRSEPFVDIRYDAYSISDLPAMLNVKDATLTRGRATVGLDVSYPLIRRINASTTLVFEPLAQVSLANSADLDPRIPVEDTQTFELDETSLFRVDRLPGYDAYEGGTRFTAGARFTINWDESRRASLFIGRSIRSETQDAFRIAIPDAPNSEYDPSGLAAQSSDWVVQGSFSPSDRMRGWAHATLDGSGNVRRAEAAMDGRWGARNLATLSYIVDRSNPQAGPLNRNYEFIQLAAQQFIYGNWGVAITGISDLERDLITRSEVGLLFDDDCFRFEIGFRQDNTRVRPSGTSEGLYLRLNLATFGGSGYDRNRLR